MIPNFKNANFSWWQNAPRPKKVKYKNDFFHFNFLGKYFITKVSFDF
jgi:hypothetical protein